MTKTNSAGSPLDVLVRPSPSSRHVRPREIFGLGALVLVFLATANAVYAQGAGAGTPSAIEVIWKWSPLLLGGFAFNILISVFAMALGTALGAVLGLSLLSENAILRRIAWCIMQFFRNSPIAGG